VRLLVKLGGTLLDSAGSRRALAIELASARAHGHEIVVVHGGGKQMTHFLAERGVESRFIGGLRVSTPEVIDAVLKVLAGTVNHQLVAALVEQGVPAVGLSGIDALVAEAEPMREELGAVGKPVRSNGALLRLLTQNGYLPVVACVAGDSQGRVYNVNADQMAASCAGGFAADRLFFLTDVDGVHGAGGGILPRLDRAGARALIAGGIATGGMQAKLGAAEAALDGGIAEVVIAPGGAPEILRRLLDGQTPGTVVVP
jgi:acetylglutamate kinase